MEVVPHIVIGLHYGRMLGEANALDICARHGIHSLVLVVVMPFYARAGTFATPATADVGRIFLEARRRLPDKQVLLGCARPAGMHKRVTDAYAVMAGLDGIAFPGRRRGRPVRRDRPALRAAARLLLDQDRRQHARRARWRRRVRDEGNDMSCLKREVRCPRRRALPASTSTRSTRCSRARPRRRRARRRTAAG